jgi:Domain of Unknown Function (DUF1080)
MTIQHFLIFVLVLINSVVATGQQMIKYDLYDLAENHKLQIFNREVKTFSADNKKGISFTANENDGVAWLDGLTFSNGVIELDIKGRDILQQSFVGIAFHGVDEKNFDAIYFRPFNFQAVDAIRKIHAVQYVSIPKYDWKKLRDEQNGKYEKAVSPAPNPNEWFHAKIEVKFPFVKVYINGNNEPSLAIEQLNTQKSGKLGLWVGNNSDGSFSNLTIQTFK